MVAAARKKKKPNWLKIRAVYETSNISQRDLAKKYDVSPDTLEARARREQWKKGKDEVTGKVTEKIRQKAIEKISDGLSTLQANAKLRQAAMANQALEAIKSVMDMSNWAFTHAVKIKTCYGMGESYEKLESKVIDAANTKAIIDIMNAIGKGQEIEDKALEYITPDNRKKHDRDDKKLELEGERLQHDKSKGNVATDGLQITFTDLPTESSGDDDGEL